VAIIRCFCNTPLSEHFVLRSLSKQVSAMAFLPLTCHSPLRRIHTEHCIPSGSMRKVPSSWQIPRLGCPGKSSGLVGDFWWAIREKSCLRSSLRSAQSTVLSMTVLTLMTTCFGSIGPIRYFVRGGLMFSDDTLWKLGFHGFCQRSRCAPCKDSAWRGLPSEKSIVKLARNVPLIILLSTRVLRGPKET
jgi:hypothetical protein